MAGIQAGRDAKPGRAQIEQERADARVQAQAYAATAWADGNARLAAGDLAGAVRALGRAARLAAADGNVGLLLASVLLRQGRLEAAADEFSRVLKIQEVAEAWLGIAACRLGLGDAAAAAAAWTRVASRTAAEPGLLSLAGRVASAAGAPGWMTLGSDGTLHLPPDQAVVASLDGVVLARRDGSWLLPAAWRAGRLLEARRGAAPLLGSPIDIASVLRVEGFVEPEAGGLRGWAWHPNDPARPPELVVTAASGGETLRLTASEAADAVTGQPPLARLRAFRLAAAALPHGMLRVTGSDGRDLLGSPLDPAREIRAARAAAEAVAGAQKALAAGSVAAEAVAAEAGSMALRDAPLAADLPAAAPPRTAALAVRNRRAVDVVVPVYRDLARTEACLEQVLATRPADTRLHVVDDASPEPAVVALLDRLARRRLILLHRQARNRGFPAAANTGLAACGRRDAILLNADTLVAPGWIEALREAAHAACDIGSATPLSNDATILSYPAVDRVNPVPDLAETRRLDALARAANPGLLVDIPTMHGFCVYLRRDCLDQVGGFREDVFAQGYGEENDLSLRARLLGWRHVAAAGVFVGHVGGASFGAGRLSLIERNLRILNRMHPGYDALIARHVAADPLAEARRRIDVARWRQGQGGRQGGRRRTRAVLIVTHDQGGGVERMIARRAGEIAAAGARAIVLRPLPPEMAGFGVVVGEGASGDTPNLRYRLPEELPALAALLAGDRPERAELHHMLGHEHALLGLLARLGVPYDVYLHDYASFCPRIALVGPERRYCGEPSLAGCEACVADAGSLLDEPIGVAALVARSAVDLAGARRVVAPAADVARRVARHFDRVQPVIEPWEDDAAWRSPGPIALGDGALRVAVLGGIGIEKGFEVLLGCVRDAAAQSLPIAFTVIGHTIDDERLMAAGPAFVTGRYREAELAGLLAAVRPALVFLPSIWPETWSYTLSHAWSCGLTVVAFDVGAMAERIRARGHGVLLPLGLPPAGVNTSLLRAAGEAAEAYGTVRDDDIGAATRGRVAGRDGVRATLPGLARGEAKARKAPISEPTNEPRSEPKALARVNKRE